MKRLARWLPALIWLTGAVSIPALEEDLSREFRLNGRETTRLFSPARDRIDQVTVQIEKDEELAAMATIVSEDGYLLSKSSELRKGTLLVTLPDGREFTPEIVAEDNDNDLALLKIEANGLTPVDWRLLDEAPPVGTWVASPTTIASRPLKIGIISAHPRPIDSGGAVMGVRLAWPVDKYSGVLIADVMKDSGAAQAGLRADDIVTQVEDTPTPRIKTLQDAIAEFEPGEKVTVYIVREEDGDALGMEFEVELGHRHIVFEMYQRNQQMSGTVSVRRAGFTSVWQHDIPLPAHAMGGPLFDLEGRVIGLNISRVNRVENYALPARTAAEATRKMLERARSADAARAVP